MRLVVWLMAMVAGIGVFSQPYPQDFHPPLDIPLVLSGTFGELRNNHFHGGIDLKTQGVEGLPVLAVADGFVSRIKVAANGYGLAVYVDHPNGYTSVYGHLQRTAEPIAQYIEEIQYKLESFEVDIYPEPGRLPVSRGARIAWSGNSGSSGGPHLHFEVRDTKTEVPINPLLFGFSVRDNVAPEAVTLYVYEKVPGQVVPTRKPMNLVKRSGVYVPETGQDTLLVSGRSVAFGLYAFDKATDASNRNGLYDLSVRAGNQPLFQFTADKIPFSETRYLNALIDYCLHQEKRRRIYTCYRKPGNFLSAYGDMPENGWYRLTSSQAIPVEMVLQDIAGNIATVQFWVRWTGGHTANPVLSSGRYLYPDSKQTIQREGLLVTIPAWSLYDTISESVEVVEVAGRTYYYLMSECVPLQYPVDATFRIPTQGPPQSKKWVAWREGEHGGQGYTGIAADSLFHVSLPVWGTYMLVLDTVPPEIRVLRKPAANVEAVFQLGDDRSGVRAYRATLNGRWVLMDYDAKTRTLSGMLPKLASGEQKFALSVSDGVDNHSSYILNWIVP